MYIDDRPLTKKTAREVEDKLVSEGYFERFGKKPASASGFTSLSRSSVENLHHFWRGKGYKNNARDMNSMMIDFHSSFRSLKGVKSCLRVYFNLINKTMDDTTFQQVLSNLKRVL